MAIFSSHILNSLTGLHATNVSISIFKTKNNNFIYIQMITNNYLYSIIIEFMKKNTKYKSIHAWYRNEKRYWFKKCIDTKF